MSKEAPSARPGDPAKWEGLRRLRYGNLLRLFRYRWGYELPNDEAGLGDLWLLVLNCSLADNAPDKKMANAISVWAPWMSDEEAQAYIKHVEGLDIYQRLMTGKEIGAQLGLTNADREFLKLWQFLPIDKTGEELAQIAKDRELRRRERARRKKGVRPRAKYLSDLAAKPKPWVAQGISRATYFRRVRRGESETIVTTERTHGVSPKEESQQRGIREGVVVEMPSKQGREVGERERNAASLRVKRTHPVSPGSNVKGRSSNG